MMMMKMILTRTICIISISCTSRRSFDTSSSEEDEEVDNAGNESNHDVPLSIHLAIVLC